MFKIKVSDIFFMVELVLNIIIIGLLANQYIFFQDSNDTFHLHYAKNQFCYGATFGPVFLILFFVMIMIAGQKSPLKTAMLVAALGAVLFLIAGCLILAEAIDEGDYMKQTEEEKYNQLVAGGVFAIILGAVFLAQLILAAINFKKGKGDPEVF